MSLHSTNRCFGGRSWSSAQSNRCRRMWPSCGLLQQKITAQGIKICYHWKRVPGQNLELKHFKFIYWVISSRSKQITEHSNGLQNSKTVLTDYCDGVWHYSHFDSKLCIAKDKIMPLLILFPDKLNGRTILGQRRGKECDRRAEAKVNWH